MIRLSTVQRMVLTFVLDQGKQGKPAIIETGYKKTRIGYFPSLQAEGVATCTTTLFFLRQNGLISAEGEDRYRLTAKGEQALGAATTTGVAVSTKEWERRTRG